MISIAPLDGAKSSCVAECAVSSHPQIEALVIHAVADAVAEWKRHLLRGSRSPLDSGSVAARNLIAALDFFLSYGYVFFCHQLVYLFPCVLQIFGIENCILILLCSTIFIVGLVLSRFVVVERFDYACFENQGKKNSRFCLVSTWE